MDVEVIIKHSIKLLLFWGEVGGGRLVNYFSHLFWYGFIPGDECSSRTTVVTHENCLYC